MTRRQPNAPHLMIPLILVSAALAAPVLAYAESCLDAEAEKVLGTLRGRKKLERAASIAQQGTKIALAPRKTGLKDLVAPNAQPFIESGTAAKVASRVVPNLAGLLLGRIRGAKADERFIITLVSGEELSERDRYPVYLDELYSKVEKKHGQELAAAFGRGFVYGDLEVALDEMAMRPGAHVCDGEKLVEKDRFVEAVAGLMLKQRAAGTGYVNRGLDPAAPAVSAVTTQAVKADSAAAGDAPSKEKPHRMTYSGE
jgi:hypothetical protein